MINHPILEESFAIIDQEMGNHSFTSAEYAIIKRVIHATADFDFAQTLRWTPDAISTAILALQNRIPIVTDVGMVKLGIQGMITKTFQNPLICAIEQAPPIAPPGKTRTELGLLRCFAQFPKAIYVIGNAPTALLTLCHTVQELEKSNRLTSENSPVLVIGVPVGFVSVLESKHLLSQMNLPQIRVEGRQGGSPVAAAILNALIVLAWDSVQRN